jgi:hypothetical protein
MTFYVVIGKNKKWFVGCAEADSPIAVCNAIDRKNGMYSREFVECSKDDARDYYIIYDGANFQWPEGIDFFDAVSALPIIAYVQDV